MRRHGRLRTLPMLVLLLGAMVLPSWASTADRADAAPRGALAVGKALIAGHQLRSAHGDARLVITRRGAVYLVRHQRRARLVPAASSSAAGRSTRLGLRRDGVLAVSRKGSGTVWTRALGPARATRLTVADSGRLLLWRGGAKVGSLDLAPAPVAAPAPAPAPSASTASDASADGTTPTPAATASPTAAPVPAAGAGTSSSPSAPAPTVRSTLAAGSRLSAGEQLTSPSGAYRVVMQRDGNLVEYGASGALWATSTVTGDGATAVMQGDGNLVVSRADGSAAWGSGTNPARDARLVLQDDGNLVVYSSGGLPLWSRSGGRTAFDQDTLRTGLRLLVGQSLVSADGSQKAVLQGDGNLVVYGSSGALWATATSTGSSLVLQGDGNLVLYSAGGGALWSSSTAGRRPDRLIMQNDGNLVLYAGSTALWASRGGAQGGAQGGAATGSSTLYRVDCSDSGYKCTTGGYAGQSTWGYPLSSNGHNCTDYAAFRLSSRMGNPGNLGNATDWDDNARRKGYTVDTTPAVGAIAQWDTGSAYTRGQGADDVGHVAVVEAWDPATGVITWTDDNWGSRTTRKTVGNANPNWPTHFIHFPG